MDLRNPLLEGETASKRRIHLGFETQGRCHQKFKTGGSVAPQKKIYILQKFIKENIVSPTKEIYMRFTLLRFLILEPMEI